MQMTSLDKARQADPDPINITREMIAAGVDEVREHRFGEGLEALVWAVYLAMETERRVNLEQMLLPPEASPQDK